MRIRLSELRRLIREAVEEAGEKDPEATWNKKLEKLKQAKPGLRAFVYDKPKLIVLYDKATAKNAIHFARMSAKMRNEIPEPQFDELLHRAARGMFVGAINVEEDREVEGEPLYVSNVVVSGDYNKIGIATLLYNAACAKWGPLLRDEAQSAGAEALWKKFKENDWVDDMGRFDHPVELPPEMMSETDKGFLDLRDEFKKIANDSFRSLIHR